MNDQAQDEIDIKFNASVARVLHREALRRAAQNANPTSGPGLERVLAQISAEATADAAERLATNRAEPTGHREVISE